MARSFLVYWIRDQIRTSASSGRLDHAASNQLARCRPGDTLWITGRGSSSRLVTIGPITIAEIVSQDEAIRRLPFKPWEADHHALAQPDTVVSPREISLDKHLARLEFISSSATRLNLEKPLGQQLQTMRELSSGSAAALEKLWRGAVAGDQVEYRSLVAELTLAGDLDAKREASYRREQKFLRRTLLLGETVGSCSICRANLPDELLVAAHIKPRSKCSDAERRDYLGNVVLMCKLGCDPLFELGYLAVADGRIRVSSRARGINGLDSLVSRLEGTAILGWTPQRKKYFRWHASNVFR